MKRSRIQNNIIHYCESHNHKRLEAFCDLDKKVLCIDCILNEDHKSHEIMSLEKAC
jgi:B-box zinc finger